MRENLSVKRGFDFGVSSYFNWKHNKTFTTLWGVRLGATQYEAKVSHTNKNGVTIDPLNSATKKSFVLCVEPTVGFIANMNDCFAFRATIGYRFSQKKIMVDNYLKSATMIARNNTAKVSLQPNGIILGAALIKKF